MQIGNNSYVDIEIQDLDIKDFLQPNDLLDLQIIETAGTALPVIYAAFFTSEQKIINHFIQRNNVIVKVGTSKEDCDSFLVSIYSSSPPNNGAMGERRLVEFGGFVLSQDFMVNLESVLPLLTFQRGRSPRPTYPQKRKTSVWKTSFVQ